MRATIWMMPQELHSFRKTGKITLKSTETEMIEVARINGTENAIVVSSTCPEFSKDMEVKVSEMGLRDLTARAIKEDQMAYRLMVQSSRNPRVLKEAVPEEVFINPDLN